MSQDKPKPINLKIDTRKVKFSKDCDFDAYDKQVKIIKKKYKCQDVFFNSNGTIGIQYKTKIIGTWKSKRIDGVIIK